MLSINEKLRKVLGNYTFRKCINRTFLIDIYSCFCLCKNKTYFKQVRSDTNLCLTKTLPAIREKSRQMETVFQKIDQLEVRDIREDRDISLE